MGLYAHPHQRERSEFFFGMIYLTESLRIGGYFPVWQSLDHDGFFPGEHM